LQPPDTFPAANAFLVRLEPRYVSGVYKYCYLKLIESAPPNPFARFEEPLRGGRNRSEKDRKERDGRDGRKTTTK